MNWWHHFLLGPEFYICFTSVVQLLNSFNKISFSSLGSPIWNCASTTFLCVTNFTVSVVVIVCCCIAYVLLSWSPKCQFVVLYVLLNHQREFASVCLPLPYKSWWQLSGSSCPLTPISCIPCAHVWPSPSGLWQTVSPCNSFLHEDRFCPYMSFSHCRNHMIFEE